MKIELCEDNGFLNDGKPTLVVLVIDGIHRIPYEATKTIQELYVDVGKFKDRPMTAGEILSNNPAPKFQNIPMPDTSAELLNAIDLKQIQREDVVKCVKVHPRTEGADEDLKVGNEYRVLSVSKKNGQVITYDVVDDKAGTKYRITCLPDELELLRKRSPKTKPVKKDYFQEIAKCAQCGTENALDLEGDKYVGECEKCQARLEKARPIAKSN